MCSMYNKECHHFNLRVVVYYFLNSAIQSEKNNIQTSFPVGAVCLCDNVLSSLPLI